MTFAFPHRVAVITGAASGIGQALAKRFARAGMRLILSDIDPDAMARTADEIAASGSELHWTCTDVSDQAAVAALADLAFDRFGAVDLLCNNAGISPGGRHRPVWEFPVEDWRWAFDVNVLGVVHGLRAFVPRMIDQGSPAHIVNTASLAGLLGGGRSPVYSASKHAVVHISEALYSQLRAIGAPIGVTLLCPGQVRTAIYESERNRPASLRPVEGVMEDPAALRGDSPAILAVSQDAETIAELTFDAIMADRFYLITNDVADAAIAHRFEAICTRTTPQFRVETLQG